MARKSQSAALAHSEQVEAFNRARDFFGNPVQRWNDWLALVSGTKTEQYNSGRHALILHCDIPVIGQKDTTSSVQIVRDAVIYRSVLVCLKADIDKTHNLQHWNQELVLIPDVQVVHGPDGIIPSLVGFYGVQNEVVNGLGNLVCFESILKGAYKFLPRVSDWKSGPLGRLAPSQNDLEVEKIKSASKIMQRVSDDECGIVASPYEGKGVEEKA